MVILATGTGSPFVTTDTAAALRGKELGVEVLLKATRVDGVYSADPEKNPHAVLYEHLTYDQVMRDELKVMDMTAIGMCMENSLPILVFNFKKEGNIERAIAGEPIGTWVSNSPARGRLAADGLSRIAPGRRTERIAIDDGRADRWIAVDRRTVADDIDRLHCVPAVRRRRHEHRRNRIRSRRADGEERGAAGATSCGASGPAGRTSAWSNRSGSTTTARRRRSSRWPT